jgi:hypothetical protein
VTRQDRDMSRTWRTALSLRTKPRGSWPSPRRGSRLTPSPEVLVLFRCRADIGGREDRHQTHQSLPRSDTLPSHQMPFGAQMPTHFAHATGRSVPDQIGGRRFSPSGRHVTPRGLGLLSKTSWATANAPILICRSAKCPRSVSGPGLLLRSPPPDPPMPSGDGCTIRPGSGSGPTRSRQPLDR